MISPTMKYAFLEMNVAIRQTPRECIKEIVKYIMSKEVEQAASHEEYLKKVLDKADELDLTDGEFMGAYYHMLIKVSYQNAKANVGPD